MVCPEPIFIESEISIVFRLKPIPVVFLLLS